MQNPARYRECARDASGPGKSGTLPASSMLCPICMSCMSKNRKRLMQMI
jgi:hypothetical protein